MNTCYVLTYHSQNVHGHDTRDNDHVALREDLEQLHAAGFKITPLSALVDWLDGGAAPGPGPLVCLTFDDGCDFDVRDLDFPGHGLQRSFLGILQDFQQRHGAAAQPGLHATSFLIASSEARRLIDARSLFGRGWMSEDWWRAANDNPLLSVGNHGWDHFHPDLGGQDREALSTAEDRAQCERQVVDAARYIEQVSGAWPAFYAYPFGRSSDYLRGQFFPRCTERHRCRAAFGTRPGGVDLDSDRWDLPRYVCGRDWRSPGELLALISP